MALFDLVPDTGLATYNVGKTVKDFTVSAQQAQKTFASYSGLSTLLIPFGYLNLKYQFTSSTPGLLAGGLALTFANLTLTKPVGKAVSEGPVLIGKGFTWVAGGLSWARDKLREYRDRYRDPAENVASIEELDSEFEGVDEKNTAIPKSGDHVVMSQQEMTDYVQSTLDLPIDDEGLRRRTF